MACNSGNNKRTSYRSFYQNHFSFVNSNFFNWLLWIVLPKRAVSLQLNELHIHLYPPSVSVNILHYLAPRVEHFCNWLELIKGFILMTAHNFLEFGLGFSFSYLQTFVTKSRFSFNSSNVKLIFLINAMEESLKHFRRIIKMMILYHHSCSWHNVKALDFFSKHRSSWVRRISNLILFPNKNLPLPRAPELNNLRIRNNQNHLLEYYLSYFSLLIGILDRSQICMNLRSLSAYLRNAPLARPSSYEL